MALRHPFQDANEEVVQALSGVILIHLDQCDGVRSGLRPFP
jgi:hypothetical protein